MKRPTSTAKLTTTLCAMLLASAALAGPIGSTGSDAFGYHGDDLAYRPRDIRTSGTALTLADDQLSGTIELGFSFSFYGRQYSRAHVSSNGFLAFGDLASGGYWQSQALPDPLLPNNLIAGFWGDLNSPAGNIRYQTSGSAGSREFTVGYYDVGLFWLAHGNPRASFEMILHEGIDDIEFQWLSTPSEDFAHSIGIENADGSTGLRIRHDNFALNAQAYCISSDASACVPNRVPEPGSGGLVATALLGLALLRRRRR